MWWHKPVILVIWKAEAEESYFRLLPRLQSEFKDSLNNLGRPCCQTKGWKETGMQLALLWNTWPGITHATVGLISKFYTGMGETDRQRDRQRFSFSESNLIN